MIIVYINGGGCYFLSDPRRLLAPSLFCVASMTSSQLSQALLLDCSLVAGDALQAVRACLCQASHDHRVLQILKRLLLLLLQVLESADQLLFVHLE